MKPFLTKYQNLPIQLKASFWFLICSFFQKGISMLTTPIFTRLLTTSEYGQYNVFNSWLGVITIIISLNLSSSVYMQGLIKFDKDRVNFSSAMNSLTTLLVFCWAIIYFLFHNFWNQLFHLSTLQMFAMLIMIWTTSIFNFWANNQRVDYAYRSLVLITVIVSIAKPLLGILFVIYANDKVTARILGLMLVELLFYSPIYFIQLKKNRNTFSKTYWKYAILFSLPLVSHYLSQIVLESADRIMISNIIGDSQAGIYSLAYALSSIMLLFNYALTQTTSPWIYKKIRDNKIKEISSISYLSLIIIAIANLLLILFAPEAVALFAPQTYSEAIWVIPPIAMSVYFMYSYDLFSKFAFYFEKTKLIMFASVAVALINIILNFIFINLFGYMAAGYTTLFCYILYSIIHYCLMHSVCKKNCHGIQPYSIKKLCLITIPFLISGFTLLSTYNYPLIRYGLIIIIIIGGIVKKEKLIIIAKRIINLKNN